MPMTQQTARQITVTLFTQYNLSGWSFRVNPRLRSVLGRCSHYHKRIELSARYLNHGEYKDIEDTILHEIAHALCPPDEGHGAIWKAKCIEIGAKPERCGKSPEIPGKWVADCTGCYKRVPIYRERDSSKRYRCMSCNSPVVFYRTDEAPPEKNIFGIPVDNLRR